MPGAGPTTRRTPSVRLAGLGGIRRVMRSAASLPVVVGLTVAGTGLATAGTGLATAGARTPAHGFGNASSAPPITVTVHPRVTPDRGGTPAHPQRVHLGVRMSFTIPPAYDPPLVSRIDAWFPRGALFEGGRYPACSKRVLTAYGPTHCPAGSILAYELSVPIPRDLQIIAGIPIVLRSLEISAGRDTWLATTGCPADRRWPWKTLGRFTDGQRIATHGTLTCRPARRAGAVAHVSEH